jgi:hypothetical protein
VLAKRSGRRRQIRGRFVSGKIRMPVGGDVQGVPGDKLHSLASTRQSRRHLLQMDARLLRPFKRISDTVTGSRSR